MRKQKTVLKTKTAGKIKASTPVKKTLPKKVVSKKPVSKKTLDPIIENQITLEEFCELLTRERFPEMYKEKSKKDFVVKEKLISNVKSKKTNVKSKPSTTTFSSKQSVAKPNSFFKSAVAKSKPKKK